MQGYLLFVFWIFCKVGIIVLEHVCITFVTETVVETGQISDVPRLLNLFYKLGAICDVLNHFAQFQK